MIGGMDIVTVVVINHLIPLLQIPLLVETILEAEVIAEAQ